MPVTPAVQQGVQILNAKVIAFVQRPVHRRAVQEDPRRIAALKNTPQTVQGVGVGVQLFGRAGHQAGLAHALAELAAPGAQGVGVQRSVGRQAGRIGGQAGDHFGVAVVKRNRCT